MAESLNDKGRRVSLELREDTIERLDALRKQWSLRSRGAAIQRLLDDLLQDLPAEHDDDHQEQSEPEDHVQGAIVLVSSGSETQEPEQEERSTGINLPGFVSRRTTKLKRSLKDPVVSEAQASGERFELMDAQQLDGAIAAVRHHWMSLYGSEPSAAVLEAAMNWLGQDIWPSSDASEGQCFTWNAVQQVMLGFCPSWDIREASVDRVVVAAGILEDPFGAASLSMRVPSLVGRMAQRLRRRRRGSPFLDLQSTMSTQGSLKLLGLPTAPGFKLSLSDIREAYRQKALACHPDAGGSAEDMRRLNEAYQLLKQRYVRTA